MQARKVPTNYAYLWLKCSLKIGENYYTLFLATSLISFFAITFTSMIPYLGVFSSLFLTYFFGVANIRLVQQVRDSRTAVLDDFFKYAFDTELLKRHREFLFALAGIGLLQILFAATGLQTFTLLVSAVGYLIVSIIIYSTFMMLQHPELRMKTALDIVIEGIVKNIVTWFLGGLLTALFATGCAILCLVPFALYFLPMTVPMSYLIYSSIYEGLDIERTLAEWNGKKASALNLENTSNQP